MDAEKKVMDDLSKTDNSLAESKTVSEIRVLPEEDIRKQKILSQYHQCPSCSAEVSFAHVANFVSNEVMETVCCEVCFQYEKQTQHPLN